MNNLMLIRKLKGLTQDELAEKLGIQKQQISRWESGNYNPNVDTIKKLCEILSVSSDILIGIKEIKIDLEGK